MKSKKPPQPQKSQAAKVSEFAALQFDEGEVATLVGLRSASDIIDKPELARAFREGRLRGQAQIRLLAMRAAGDGEATARRQMLDLALATRDAVQSSEPCASCAGTLEHLRRALGALGDKVDGLPPEELARLAADRLRTAIDANRQPSL
jgi:hypothetical protein